LGRMVKYNKPTGSMQASPLFHDSHSRPTFISSLPHAIYAKIYSTHHSKSRPHLLISRM
jgi:hypothetical protein